MKQTCVVAVNIVTYNNASTIEACLTSLKAQALRNYQLCVIDNNSTDDTVKIVEKFAPSVIEVNATNIGYAAAHNQALLKSRSTYVLTLNPDVVLDKYFLKNMVDVMDNQNAKTIGSAAGLLFRVNNMRVTSTIVDGAGLYMLRSRRQVLRYEGQNVRLVDTRQTHIFGPDGAAAFYRRKMLEDIDLGDGVFDEHFYMHKEDVDVDWRAQLRGWSSLFVGTARARHIRTFRAGQRDRVDLYMRILAIRNRYYLLIKNEISWLFWRDFVWIILYDIGIFLYICLKERSSLVAYTQLFAQLPTLFRKRRRIQSARRAPLSMIGHLFVWRKI